MNDAMITIDRLIDYLKFRREQGYDLDEVISQLETNRHIQYNPPRHVQ